MKQNVQSRAPFYNDQKELKLIALKYFWDDHIFNVINLPDNFMEMRCDWEMVFIGKNPDSYDVSMLIKRVK